MKGYITTIQRMSIHDGPGIRSTLFMKGCNLRCKWCHNPETISSSAQLQHIISKCTSCGLCADHCPDKATAIIDGKLKINRSLCTTCGTCTATCPNNAILTIGKEISVDDAFMQLDMDRIFYETSGGGVTVSGGEPFLQPDFTVALLEKCFTSGLDTAVETNLAVPWERIEKALPFVNLWMCDVKTLCPKVHKEWTGADNARILDNLERLSHTGARILARTPVIPGVNDTVKDIEAICRFLSSLKAEVKYELLGFHTLGFGKYRDLGMKNPMKGMEGISNETMETLHKTIRHYGYGSNL